MRKMVFVLLLLWPSLALAGVVNVEFKFTPFIGDPEKADKVETVPGKASVFINNIPIAEQEVSREEVPVLFDEKEIAASVWVPVASLGPALRKGTNKIRIEFEPQDRNTPYRAQLRWASVTDEVTKSGNLPGRMSETNQTGEGVDDRKVTGRVVFEREFTADFAADRPWHHYPPVATLSDEDKKELTAIVKQRLDIYKPDFSAAYKLLSANPEIPVAKIKKLKCLDKSYSAGIRITFGTPDNLDFLLTGNPEVIIRGKAAPLYYPADPSLLDKVKGDDVQMCVMSTLMALFPDRLVVVRTPAGKWEVTN